jgi:hypothetical protein
MYKVLLSFEAKEELLRKNEKELNIINNKIENILHGLWKGGTRVKKLRGVNKKRCIYESIYEARIGKAPRMIFSIHKDKLSKEHLVFIHRLTVEHDDVIRTACAVLGNEYSEDMYNLDNETENETVIDNIIKDEESCFAEQEEVYSMLDKMKAYELTDEDLIRILSKEKVTEEDLIDFRLRLTSQQINILEKPAPQLVAGTAGSGKTTLLIYKLLKNPLQPKLYITYSEKLCNEAKKLFNYLVNGRDYEQQYKENTHFVTFHDILNSLCDNTINSLMTKERFFSEYMKYAMGNHHDKKFPPLMVWEEIRGVWKSGIKRERLPLDKYLKLSEEEAPNFYGVREEAYKIYMWYENYLKTNFMEDELDKIRTFLESERNVGIKYTLIACDEVQDLTKLHILLLFKISMRDPRKIVIAGDDHQIINHSGFRWENIKNLFYNDLKTPINGLDKLDVNFRCPGSIANLAYSINELQKEFIDTEYKTKIMKSDVSGKKPILLYNIDEESLIKYICNLGPTQVVLVKDIDEQNNLRNKCIRMSSKTPLIFTIDEAKGLEFDIVVLWKLARDKSGSNDIWEKIDRSRNTEVDGRIKKFIRYESSLLYVAITRAIKDCYIYDGFELAKIWTYTKIKEKINFQTSLYSFQEIEKRVFTAAEWFTQGNILLKQKLYLQSMECFSRISDSLYAGEARRLLKICEANISISRGELEKAGNIFVEINMINEAAECFDNASLYDKAIELFQNNKYGFKNTTKANDYNIKKYDMEKKWERSAIFCRLNHRFEDAVMRFEKARFYKNAAFIAENDMRDFKKALQLYKLANDERGIKRCKDKIM